MANAPARTSTSISPVAIPDGPQPSCIRSNSSEAGTLAHALAPARNFTPAVSHSAGSIANATPPPPFGRDAPRTPETRPSPPPQSSGQSPVPATQTLPVLPARPKTKTVHSDACDSAAAAAAQYCLQLPPPP